MRLKAQTNQKHYVTRQAEVKTKVEEAEANVKLAEEEFEVGFNPFFLPSYHVFVVSRRGQSRLQNIANASRIPETQML